MGTLAINRRRFLETSSHLAVGAAAIAAAGGAAVVAPDLTWAATRIISPAQAASLTVDGARICSRTTRWAISTTPRRSRRWTRRRPADPALAAQLVEGVARLDQAMGIPFLKLSSGNQLRVIEGPRGDTVLRYGPQRHARVSTPTTWSRGTSASKARRWNTAATSTAASTTSAGCPRCRTTPRGRQERWLCSI